MLSVHEKLERIRERLATDKIDAWLINSADPHLCEYPPQHWLVRGYVSGFHGSAGRLVVTPQHAALFVDSRYWEIAEKATQGTPIEVIRSGAPHAPDLATWLAAHLPKNATLASSAQTLSAYEAKELKADLNELDLNLALQSTDIMDELWVENRPALPNTELFELETSSPDRAQKLARLRQLLASQKCDAVALTALDDIAWLTNARAKDIDYCPLFVSDMIVTRDEAILFINPSRVPLALMERLEKDGITLFAPDLFIPTLLALKTEGQRFWLDPKRTNAEVAEVLTGNAYEATSPVTLLKARKSPGEIAAIREAMFHDGVALVEFYAELEEDVNAGNMLTEMKCAERLYDWRHQQPGFLDLSFEAIVAFGPHAAQPHYMPSEASDVTLTRGLLLIDSGAQYRTGTTDITRMSAIGELTPEEREHVTLVLKAHIALARATFSEKTTGYELDRVCRAPLHKAGLDFGHGTGHGVGFVSNVHEGPFHISPCSTLPIPKHQLVSNEPGLYFEGKHGVRIENLILAVPNEAAEDPSHALKFETLTLCPIDRGTFDEAALTPEEKAWLNAYHARVYAALFDHVSHRAQRWLTTMCAPL